MIGGYEVKMPTGVSFQSVTMLYFCGLNGLSPSILHRYPQAGIPKLVTSLLEAGVPPPRIRIMCFIVSKQFLIERDLRLFPRTAHGFDIIVSDGRESA